MVKRNWACVLDSRRRAGATRRTEGFDTADLKNAKALVDERAHS
jgi:hypothetical protein